MSSNLYRVLLIEDVLVIAKITEQMLKKSPTNQYITAHRTRLDEGLAALKEDDFDIILLDLNLPDSRELATLQTVIEAAPDVPIIVLTASNTDESGIKSVQLGAQDFLLKGDFNYLTLDRAILYACERHRLQRTIRQLAVLDELTGLYNRRGFNTLNPDIIARVKQTKATGFLCYFDLDRFKQINDELGHAKGDEALIEFTKLLRSVFRKDVLLVRLGGDEFVAMGLESQPGQVNEALWALNVVLGVRNEKNRAEFILAASAGAVYFDHQSTLTIDELGAAADAALYENKEARREERTKTQANRQPQEIRS